MAIFSVVFGRLARMDSEGSPYPIFVFTGLLPWLFVSQGLNVASNSLVGNAGLITKVYFPRLIIPAASILSSLVDFAVSFGRAGLPDGVVRPHADAALALAAVAGCSGPSLLRWASVSGSPRCDVQFRDVRLTIPFLTQVWMFASPIVYPASLIESRWRTLMA